MVTFDDLLTAERLRRLLSPLRNSDSLLLKGKRRIPVTELEPNRWKDTDEFGMAIIEFGVRIEYKGVSRRNHRRRLSYRNHWIGTLSNSEIVRLHNLLRDVNVSMMVDMVFAIPHYMPAKLAVPTKDEITRLSEIIKIHRAWPSSDDLAAQIAAERVYQGLKGPAVTFKGSRHPSPLPLKDKPFWEGFCRVSQEWPDPGVRRSPVITLSMLDGSPLLECRPSSVLYAPLERRLGRHIRAAAISKLADGDRKPSQLLRFD